MTTATGIPGLTVTNEANGKTYYEPVIRQCKGGSKFNDKKSDEQRQYQFDNLEDYWSIGKNTAPHAGGWYSLELSTKPADKGMWRDIVRIEDVDGPATSTMPESSVDRATDEAWDGMGDKSAMDPENRSERANKGIIVEGVVQGHLEKLATDLYISEGSLHIAGIDYTRIREIRDGFFHHVKEHPIMPLHWCYTHEEPRRPTKADSWFHEVGGGNYCSEDGILDAQGNKVEGE